MTKKLPQTNDYTYIETEVKSKRLEPSIYASVVIPFYKGKIYLERTLYSIKGQSYPQDLYEVIIVQDVGGEMIDDLVFKFENKFRLRLIKIPHIGFAPARSRNVGIKNAHGEVIISLDFDMICPSRFIDAHLKWYHISKNIATFGLRKFIDASGIKPKDIIKNMKDIEELPSIESISNTVLGSITDKRLPEIKIIKKHPFPCNCFHGCNVAYLKHDALDAGLYDEEFNFNFGYEDIEFGYRLWEKGLYLVFEPEALALHQENSVVTPLEKLRGREVNRVSLYKKVPGIGKFRESLSEGKSD